MNYLIQRGKVRGQFINVPQGLPELLSDITREVLRCQPITECLCQFIIDYLHSVIITREKALIAKRIIDRALRTVDDIISEMCICDISKKKNEEMGRLMEECFKRFLEKRRCEEHKEREIVKFHEEDILDELLKKCKFTELELKLSKPMIVAAYERFIEAYSSAAENSESIDALYTYFKERELRRNEDIRKHSAATKIQAHYRGFKVRQEWFVPKDVTPQSGSDDSSLDYLDQAARIIQKFFRENDLHKVAPTSVTKITDVCEPVSQISIGVEDMETLKASSPKVSPKQSEAAQDTIVGDEKPTAAAAEEEETLVHEIASETAVETAAAVPESESQAAPEPEPEPEPAPEPEPEPETAAAEEPAPAADEEAPTVEEPPAAAEE